MFLYTVSRSSVILSIFHALCLSASFSASVSVAVCLCLSVCLSACLSVFVCLSVYPPPPPSPSPLSLSLSLFLSLSLSPCLFMAFLFPVLRPALTCLPPFPSSPPLCLFTREPDKTRWLITLSGPQDGTHFNSISFAMIRIDSSLEHVHPPFLHPPPPPPSTSTIPLPSLAPSTPPPPPHPHTLSLSPLLLLLTFSVPLENGQLELKGLQLFSYCSRETSLLPFKCVRDWQLPPLHWRR